jgi:DNA segregation ATPase FtsK/SpoIIIE-like protein
MLLVCLSFIFYKNKIIGLNGVRKLFIRILGGKVTEPLNEFVVHKNDVTPTPISVQNIELEATNREQLTPPIHLLSDTSINNDFVNEDMAKKYNEKILKLLQNNDVVVTPLTIQTMPLFVEITFSLQNESDINKILSLRNELINALKNSVINITMKGNTLKFDIKNKQPSHVSIKSIIGDSGSIEPYTSVIGSTFNSQHLLLNFNTHNNCLIIGNEGSGAMMLFTSFIISLAYFNSPDNLKFLFLFPTVNKTLKSFNDLPHALKPIIYEKNKIFEELQLLKREIENRT